MPEPQPPWKMLTDPPWSGAWRQGDAEAYLDYTWRPFYDSLSEAGQAAYLERWNASEDWREFLSPGYLDGVDDE